jgi:oligoendopeptidase F
MVHTKLPATSDAFVEATWDDILPYFESLATSPLDNENVEEWLKEWSTLEELVNEAASRASVGYTTDTSNADMEQAHLRFSSEIRPRMQEQSIRLAKRLVDLGYERDDLTTTLRRFRNQFDLFREENVPLNSEIARLNAQYQKITGAMTVKWDGEEKTLPQLQPFLRSEDRETRERAFRLSSQPYIDRKTELADLFDEQFALRVQVAQNAGFDNFRDYTFREKNRFHYTPEDCEQFHQAVERTVVPAVERIRERRRQQLGLDSLRPWDLDVDPLGRPPLQPFDDVSDLVGRAIGIFQRVDPLLGDYFQQMSDENLLDLESRKNKAPGGYCTSLPHRGQPFIFMNSVEVAGDVRTLLHEAGHAFHTFEAHKQPLIWQRHPGSEMAEVASMSMELLSAPYITEAQGGYYSVEDAQRARVEHLEGLLALLPHIASVDAFQHWIYTSGQGQDRDARDAAWLDIRNRFEPGINWSGLEPQRLARWYRQLHIFLLPFYYIEYGIAQLGALQVWRNSLEDSEGATAAYRQALALGATRPLPELFEAAGAKLAFDETTFAELVDLVEQTLNELRED